MNLKHLLEVLLIDALCAELDNIFQGEFCMMTDRSVINYILLDLIKSEDYTIDGIATYTHIPQEVIYDIAIGNNTNPTLDVSRKIIELHKGVRADLYHRVMEKITEKYKTN